MDQVGRYQILEELGRGAHGVVYKALDPAIGRTIAIKAIALADIHSADRTRVREDILREARLAGTLSHPNIVTVYDVVEGEDAAFIVMEFVDGESLESAMEAAREHRAGRLSRAGFLSVFRQIAQALDYAHRRGVIHRDVKPANIGLTNERVGDRGELLAKIADFGVAQFTSGEITQPLGVPALVGTPNYMSPEQVAGAKIGRASDQFSLAVIAYEVLTGQKAFVAQSLETLLYRIRFDPEELVNEVNPGLSSTAGKVMRRALAKKPEERFSTCAEFAGALEFALADSPGWAPGVYGVAAESADTPIVPNFVFGTAGDDTPTEEKKSWVGTAAMLIALGLAVGLAIVLIVRMNSGSSIPTQVLETKNAPVSPPPSPPLSIDELKEDRRAPDSFARISRVPSTPAPAMPVPSAPQPESVKKIPAPVKAVRQIASGGEVQFLTDPPGANLSVDGGGINTCTAPCSFLLAGGRHTLSATLSGFAVTRKIFYVPADLNIFIPLIKSIGVLLVSSDPSGAQVNVDGAPAGITPLTLRLAAGAHRISVYDGARWHDESVQVTGDEVHTRLFRF